MKTLNNPWFCFLILQSFIILCVYCYKSQMIVVPLEIQSGITKEQAHINTQFFAFKIKHYSQIIDYSKENAKKMVSLYGN